MSEPETVTVWEALEGSQQDFLNSPVIETLLHGSRGGGKTECALMAFCKEVGKGYGDRWIGVILRRQYKALDDIVNKSHRIIRRLFPDAKFFAGKGDFKWKFATGEELRFRTINHVRDYEANFHGQELPFILFEELTTWPDPSCYDKLKSCNRHAYQPQSPDDPPTMPKKYLSTTNPSGVGHGWVKQRFIDAGPVGEVIREVDKSTGEATERVHIASSWAENPFLDNDYIKSLNAIEDENLKKAWLFGSWDVVAGGMFDDVWRPNKHIVEPFKIPSSWRVDRSFDWGSSRPFCTLWFAESDGTDYEDVDGNEIPTIRGDMFCILEDYGWNGNPNEGLRLTNREIAMRIRELEKEHPYLEDIRVKAGPADTAIYTVENGSSVADDMKGLGIYWKKADKSAGSRVAGWQVIRQKLKNAMTGEGLAGLRFFSTCHHSLRLIPTTPRCEKNPDDIDTDAEDHLQDALRYRCRKKKAATGSRQI
jgi:hypothetical protein